MASGDPCSGLAQFIGPILICSFFLYRAYFGDSGTSRPSRHREPPKPKPPEDEMEVDPGWDQANHKPSAPPADSAQRPKDEW